MRFLIQDCSDPVGVLNKTLYGKAPSDVQPLTLLNNILARKGTLFIHLLDLLPKWYPFRKSSLEH